jgi:predicted nucleic acid-binding protein
LPARRVYWDACAFIGLLNQEPGKVNVCSEVWREAERGETIICTSFLSFAEVFRMKCEGQVKPLAQANDEKVENLLRQKWIVSAVIDERIAVAARRLMRSYAECRKPTDGIHLATALAMSVDQMHTYDGADLLGLDGKIHRADGKPLTICTPRLIERAPPEPLPLFGA